MDRYKIEGKMRRWTKDEQSKTYVDRNGYEMEVEGIIDLHPIHAHWVKFKDEDAKIMCGNYQFGVKCSNCGIDIKRKYGLPCSEVMTLKYCCECGAKMDGKEYKEEQET